MQKREFDKNETTKFFDELAHGWDARLKDVDHSVADEVVRRAKILKNASILDVGCGTGVFTNSLLNHGISNVTAIDLSSKMIEVLHNKFPMVNAVCGDFDTYNFKDTKFDIIVVYNAFPHFSDYAYFFSKAKTILKSGGTLVIAHSMNRLELNEMHRRAGRTVENDILISDDEFEKLYFLNSFNVIEIEDNRYFYACGRLK